MLTDAADYCWRARIGMYGAITVPHFVWSRVAKCWYTYAMNPYETTIH
ncbi:hypothetical protein [Paenibacillus sp. PAMC 26794]|nr:hypothetical protein [Paenibacillus sp. PAMC 26794]